MMVCHDYNQAHDELNCDVQEVQPEHQTVTLGADKQFDKRY